jgi:hypothetical protein
MSLPSKLLPVAAILVLAGIGGVGYAYLGKASLHLVVPEGRTIELSANGRALTPTSASGRHVAFKLAQGRYEVSVKDTASGKERKYALELDSGFADYLLPIDERQCFKRMDVIFGGAMRVKDQISAQEPISLKYGDYLDLSELPKRSRRRRNSYLLEEVDCGTIGL